MYYQNDGTTIDSKWVDSEARAVAKKLVIKTHDNKLDQERSIKSSQLRKFYAEVKSLERLWEYQKRSEAAFMGILPQIKILKAKAAYARGRKTVPPFFTEWMNKHADAINTTEDFKAFLLHFEAVVGFCYGEGLKD